MNPVQIIEKKRDGGQHTRPELDFLCRSALDGSFSPEQLSAWLMAVVLRGMTLDETADLTLAMAESGERVDLSGLPEPWLDKHSTGGIGDKTTLVLLPLLAASGYTVVKMSGRGLGITGGTIDKLESIPGFRTALPIQELKSQAGQIGLALTGQTPDLAPADKLLYALRDTTGTVPSIPLIASSVLSKKIAGGAQVIGIDLKCGNGAFMKSAAEASELAATMLEIGKRVGIRLGVEVTPMDEPLGLAVGNLCEVQEAVRTLKGQDPGGFGEFCVRMAADLMHLAGLKTTEAEARARQAWVSGTAWSKFQLWISTQGGDADGIERLEMAPLATEWKARQSGVLTQLRADLVGQAVLNMGGGRKHRNDQVDHGVGVVLQKKTGDQVLVGETLGVLFTRSTEQATEALQTMEQATQIG